MATYFELELRRDLPIVPALKSMPSSLPRISVITPSFNQGPYIQRTIESVLDQGYANLEYIIIDGGSDDRSVEIIRKYSAHLTYWTSERDSGQSNAINKGMARATGSVLTWLNSDDYYLPGALQTISEWVETQPETDVFVGIGEMVDTNGRVIYHIKPPAQITLDTLFRWQQQHDFLQPSCFFRDRAWKLAGPLDESIHIAFDVDLWMRMARSGCTYGSIDRVLSQALSHSNAKTSAYVNLMTVDFAIVAIRHGGEAVVRKSLEDMAMRLSWAEPNLEKILGHPLVRMLRPLAAPFMKPAVKRRDTVPHWLKSP